MSVKDIFVLLMAVLMLVQMWVINDKCRIISELIDETLEIVSGRCDQRASDENQTQNTL